MDRPLDRNELQIGDTRLLIGDCRKLLPELESESVQCCITSPPYWGLRDYEHPDQLGCEASPGEYVAHLVAIFREVRRILRPDGTLWLNIGDGYARNGGTGRHGPNARVGNTRKLIQKRNCRVPDCWGLKDRDLLGLPWRVAFALQEDGWILRSHIVWIKKTPMPESVRNRPSRATEDIFLLAKQARYFYDNQAVRESSGANLKNYWLLGSESSTSSHPAAFPKELARRCILLATRPGDVILDPFAGSGTTALAAQELSRKCILIELNTAYARAASRRIQLHTQRELWL
jgi:DNA modification methylase